MQAAGNRAYEERFGHVFLLRTAGRTPGQILAELDRRLAHEPAAERAGTTGQLAEITRLRVERLVSRVSISTHVLDATTGRPAAGLAVRLSDVDGVPLVDGHTNPDGRCALAPYDLEPGTYELTFDTGGYFDERTFYPSVTVTFRITDGGAHHHVPLLLSPWSYTTYRGS